LVEACEGREYHTTGSGTEDGVSDRWVRTLLKRMSKQGDAVVVHGLRGRPSNRKLSAETQRQALAILKQPDWHDFGPIFAAEQLGKRHQIEVGKETLRGWMPSGPPGSAFWRSALANNHDPCIRAKRSAHHDSRDHFDQPPCLYVSRRAVSHPQGDAFGLRPLAHCMKKHNQIRSFEDKHWSPEAQSGEARFALLFRGPTKLWRSLNCDICTRF
jgi:hypothetical protein